MRWLRALAVLLATVVGFLSVAVGATAAAAAAPTVSVVTNSKLGPMLVASNGMTLYRFTKDTANIDNCTGACAAIWPALTVTGTPTAGTGVTGKLGTIKIAGGKEQVTYNGWPLYYFSGDKKAGDTTGQGFKNLWYVVAPTVAVATAATATAATTPTTTAAATLPKTGSGPLPDAAGVALLLAGAALLVVRRRRAA